MKKFYEAPAVEELYADATALMNDDGFKLSGNSDESEQDVIWDLLNK